MSDDNGLAKEPHSTLKDVATRWGIKSPETIRHLFITEPGVLKLGTPKLRGKRSHIRLLIPDSVAARVHERWSRPLGEV